MLILGHYRLLLCCFPFSLFPAFLRSVPQSRGGVARQELLWFATGAFGVQRWSIALVPCTAASRVQLHRGVCGSTREVTVKLQTGL
jgi:hypothetical protein